MSWWRISLDWQCDGWPTYIENDVAGWIDNTDGNGLGQPGGGGVGHIGFWNYTITAELTGPPTELRPISTAIPLPAALPVGMMMLGALGVRGAVRKAADRRRGR